MENKLVVQLGENQIVAEIDDRSAPEIPPEIVIYLQDKEGNIIQDICLVRPHYEYNRKAEEFETSNDFVDCLVWGDSWDEDYTDKHVIGVYEEEEE